MSGFLSREEQKVASAEKHGIEEFVGCCGTVAIGPPANPVMFDATDTLRTYCGGEYSSDKVRAMEW